MPTLSRLAPARVLFGLLILWCLSAAQALAQSVGSFVSAGAMVAPRDVTPATLLKDGRVLIAGGNHYTGIGGCHTLANAELYDPGTQTFTPTGNLLEAREFHTATLLSDGRVLIAGGSTCANSALFSAELYDPATGTFTATGNLNSPRSNGSAALLSNGKVLIAGGGGCNLPCRVTAEIYDPTAGVFTPAGPVDAGSDSMVLLKDGRVLIPSGSISLYEIAGNSLKPVASLPESGIVGYQASALLMNGRVLITGGACVAQCKVSDDDYLYDPHSGTLQPTGLLAIPRCCQAATLLPGGRVLIVGGGGNDYDAAIQCPLDAEEYDPSTGGFTYAGTESFQNCFPTATLLADGRVLVTGGDGFEGAGAELYVPPLRVASAASLTGPLAPESVGSMFGSRLASTTASAADPHSPPTTLGGISVNMRDSTNVARLAPLFLVSPSEIRFEVPPGIAPGDVTLEIINPPVPHEPAVAHTGNVAPGIFPFDDNLVAGPPLARGAIVLDGAPVDLVAYATGVRNRSTLGNVRATIGGTGVSVNYAGPDASGVPGLDQVKVIIPSDFRGRGFLDLVLTVDGVQANTTSVQIVSGGREDPGHAPRGSPGRR